MKITEMSKDELKQMIEDTVMNTQPERIFLTYDELAEYLQTSKSKLEKLKSEERIPYCQVDGMVRFNKNQIDLWLASSGSKLTFSKRDKAKLEVLQ